MDITERREMERRLYQQQEFARRLVDSFPDLILVLDAAGHYTFTSPRVKDVLGYEPEEYDMQELGERTHVEDRPALQRTVRRNRRGSQVLRLPRNSRAPQARRVAPDSLPLQPSVR